MSELKTYIASRTDGIGLTDYYLKSEADKVLAEKDKEIARLDDLAHAHNIELLRKENLIEELKKKEVLLGKTLNTISESHKHVVSLARKCNHVNYKRCLAMARWCNERHTFNETNEKRTWLHKWHNRWLELAEKFKTNSTAQQGKEEVK